MPAGSGAIAGESLDKALAAARLAVGEQSEERSRVSFELALRGLELLALALARYPFVNRVGFERDRDDGIMEASADFMAPGGESWTLNTWLGGVHSHLTDEKGRDLPDGALYKGILVGELRGASEAVEQACEALLDSQLYLGASHRCAITRDAGDPAPSAMDLARALDWASVAAALEARAIGASCAQPPSRRIMPSL